MDLAAGDETVIYFWERLCASLRYWVVDHWRGDLSLAESFWINCFFVNLGVGILWQRVLLSQAGKVLSQAGVVLFGVLLVGVSVWQLVGLWRSAQKNNTKQSFWAALAQGWCVLNVVFFVLIILAGLFGGFGEGGIPLPVPNRPSNFL